MGRTRIAVHVTPRSIRDEIAGWRGEELSVRVTAVPEGGRANAALCRVIAEALDVPKSSVRVVRGGASRHKRVEVEGISAAEAESRLGRPSEPRR